MFRSKDALISDNYSSGKLQVLWQVVLGCLLSCCMALVVGVLAAPEEAYAANGPAVGTKFTVPVSQSYVTNSSYNEGSGTLTFRVTKQSKGSGIGEVTIVDGTGYVAKNSSSVLTLYKVKESTTGEWHNYYVTGVDRCAFKENGSLYGIKFSRSLTTLSTQSLYETQAAIGASAFEGCSNLRTVSFSGAQVEGIAEYAFRYCTSLESVTFADSTKMTTKGIYTRAFQGCTSLKHFTVPPILCSEREYTVYSGYQTVWHSDVFCVKTPAISPYVFYGCDSLESITFKAGCTYGMFAYWRGAGCGLRFLPSLKSVIYEGAEPYFGDEDASLTNQQLVQLWGDGTDAETEEQAKGANPTFYYAVDYYYTSDQLATAEQTDGYRSGRIARTEYAKGTSISAIQSGDAEALAGCTADSSLYAQKTGDATIPDPNEAAKAVQALYKAGAAGYEAYAEFANADQYEWVWHLDGGQSRRSGLADSCGAYLVRADSLVAARVVSDPEGANQIEAMYRVASQNLGVDTTKEPTGVQDTMFDPERYYGTDAQFSYRYDQDKTDEQRYEGESGLVNMTNPVNETATMTPWFTLDAGGLLTLPYQMTLYDGAGKVATDSEGDTLTLGDLVEQGLYSVTYERYVVGEDGSASYEVVDPAVSDLGSGPLLMTVTPLEGSGYDTSTCLKEWILVGNHVGSVLERYSDSSRTWLTAIYGDGNGNQPRSSFLNGSGTYATCVGTGDAASALLAASYAGLCDGPVNVLSDGDAYESAADYGFSLALGDDDDAKTAFYTNGTVHDASNLKTFERGDDSPSEQANSCIAGFARNQEGMGLSALTWSKTALLVNPTYLEESATAAASFAYTQSSPIFYTEPDGTLSEDTLSSLKDFTGVIVVGDESMVSEDTYNKVEGLGGNMKVSRVQGEADGGSTVAPGNACALSIAMADYLLADDVYGVSCSSVAIIVASGSDLVTDAVSCQNFSGHEDGITLVVSSSADAKAVAHWVQENKRKIFNVRLFGRDGSAANVDSFTLYSLSESGEEVGALSQIWDENAEEIPAIAAGDTAELWGVLFEVGEDGSTLSSPVRRWGTSEVSVGGYTGLGTDGTAIAYQVAEGMSEVTTKVDIPVAKSGLVYTGGALAGVTAGVGYTVTGGTAKDAGNYTATLTLNYGYSWSDGTKSAKTIAWSISPSSQANLNVVLSSATATYTGSNLAPTVSSVTLADGTKLKADSYSVSYSEGKQTDANPVSTIVNGGSYTVIVTLKGNYTGTAMVDFTVTVEDSDDSGNSGNSGSDDSGSDAYDSEDEESYSGSSSVSGSVSPSSSSDSSSSSNRTTTAEVAASSLAAGDGWTYFYAPGNPEGYDFNASSASVVSLGSELAPADLVLLLVCVLAVAGTIVFATKYRKETDDLLEGSPDA